MRDAVEGDILAVFETHAADPFKLLLVVHLILYIPVDFVVIRNSLNVFLSISEVDDHKQPEGTTACGLEFMRSNWVHFIVTVSILSSAVLVVLMLAYGGVSNASSFDKILNFTGSIAGGFISFVLPAALYLKVKGQNADNSLKAQLLFAFGASIMIIVPICIFLADS